MFKAWYELNNYFSEAQKPPVHVEKSDSPLFVPAFGGFATNPDRLSMDSHGLDIDPKTGPNIILTHYICILGKTCPIVNSIRAHFLMILSQS